MYKTTVFFHYMALPYCFPMTSSWVTGCRSVGAVPMTSLWVTGCRSVGAVRMSPRWGLK